MVLSIFVKLSQHFDYYKRRLSLSRIKVLANIYGVEVQRMMIYISGMSLTRKQGWGLYKHHSSTIKMMADRQQLDFSIE